MKAQGKDCEVRIEQDKLILDHPGGFGVLRRLPELFREGPDFLLKALNGPSKAVLMDALATNKELLVRVVQAVRQQDPDAIPEGLDTPEKQGVRKLVEAVTTALGRNRGAVAGALRENKDLVAAWLKSHRELVGIFLEGDVHLFLDDVVDTAISRARSGDGYMEVEAMGVTEPIRVEFSQKHSEEFEALLKELQREPDAQGAAARSTEES